MKKSLIFFILLFVGMIFLRNGYTASALDRLAVCDLCGFCISPTPEAGGAPPHDPPPQKWEDCRACLYPNASNNPESFDTLKINDDDNLAPTPALGRHYTMIGCLSTTTSDFSKPGAAGGVIQPILNILFAASGGIAFMYLIYGSFILLTSQSRPENINKGKQIIWGSVIGLVFILFSVFLVNLIANGVLKLPGFGS